MPTEFSHRRDARSVRYWPKGTSAGALPLQGSLLEQYDTAS
jgi:hypothetical protein